jgi:peptide/nickel transport system substrate-binding protein
MEPVDKILQDSALMVQPYRSDKFTAVSSRVRNYKLHPTDYFNVFKVCLG